MSKFYIINGMIRSEILSDFGTKSVLINEEYANDLSRKLQNNCIRHSTHRQGNKVMILAQLRREDDASVMDRVVDNYVKTIGK